MSERSLRLVQFIGGAGGVYDSAPDPEGRVLDSYLRVAKNAEEQGLTSLFIADNSQLLRDGDLTRLGALEPLSLFSALAAATERIGLIATVSTTFWDPYNLARVLGTLDQVSDGRAGWNAVTSFRGEGNFGYEQIPSPEERYARAEEFIDVVDKLWRSWSDDAIEVDSATGRAWSHPDRVRDIDHIGPRFRIAGALDVPPSRQGRPILAQAGGSDRGRDLGARRADLIYAAEPTWELASDFARSIHERARAAGRAEGSPVILTGLNTIFASTQEEGARLRWQRVESFGVDRAREALSQRLGDIELSDIDLDDPIPADRLPDVSEIQRRQGRFAIVAHLVRERLPLRELLFTGGVTWGHWTEVGSPEQIADLVQARFEAGLTNAITIGTPSDPSQHQALWESFVPELVRRGLFRPGYHGRTLRENLLRH